MLFLSYLFAAVILAITPGPGMAYVIARTLSGGIKVGLASCVGTGIGGFVHVISAATGISLLLANSALAFMILKYMGAVYLVFLGVRLLSAKRHSMTKQTIPSMGIKRAFVEGVVVEALNVKTALFFLAFLPQFTSTDEPLMMQLVVLGSICVLLNTCVDVLAVVLAQRFKQSLRNNPFKLLSGTSGVTLIGLGTYLALADRS